MTPVSPPEDIGSFAEKFTKTCVGEEIRSRRSEEKQYAERDKVIQEVFVRQNKSSTHACLYDFAFCCGCGTAGFAKLGILAFHPRKKMTAMTDAIQKGRA